jgi:deoxyribonuclease-4
MSTSGGFWRALERGHSIGCDCIQLFVKNNMQWYGKPPTAEDAALFKAKQREFSIQSIFGHAGYLINLGGPSSPNRDHSLQSLLQEIQFADALGVPFLVLHPGAHLGAGEAEGIKRIVAGLDEVLRATKSCQVRIALENTAGQGTCLGHELRHLAAVYDGVASARRLGVCIDTAHLFAAGYDIRTANGWDAAMTELDKLVGLDQVLAFHLNDSKTGLGSRVDRHADIGLGEIGREGFRHVVRDTRFKDHPGCLETPKSKDLHEDVRNLATLRRLSRQQR